MLYLKPLKTPLYTLVIILLKLVKINLKYKIHILVYFNMIKIFMHKDLFDKLFAYIVFGYVMSLLFCQRKP